jgi:hypothetical protein
MQLIGHRGSYFRTHPGDVFREIVVFPLGTQAGLIIPIMSPVLFTPEKECYTVLIL